MDLLQHAKMKSNETTVPWTNNAPLFGLQPDAVSNIVHFFVTNGIRSELHIWILFQDGT